MRVACSFVLSASLLSPSYSQAPTQSSQDTQNKQSAQQPEAAPLKQPLAFGLEGGTPIKLRLIPLTIYTPGDSKKKICWC
jgi:hypothetical protein